MSVFGRIFWLTWFLSTLLLVMILLNFQSIELIFFLVLFALIGNLMYEQRYYSKKIQKISEIIRNLDFSPIESGINNFNKKQEELIQKNLKIQKDIEKYKIEQENKYRDVVRKVIELENDLNKKFKTLGEVLIKLNKDMEED